MSKLNSSLFIELGQGMNIYKIRGVQAMGIVSKCPEYTSFYNKMFVEDTEATEGGGGELGMSLFWM
jgi:hypothetical protein